jgi:hypothetical protein
MEKKQHIRWTRRGTQMLLQARCAQLNGELGKYTPVAGLRIIAGAGGGGMNLHVLSGPDLSTVRHRGRSQAMLLDSTGAGGRVVRNIWRGVQDRAFQTVNMNASLPPASPTHSPLAAPLPPSLPTLKTRSTAATAAITCMILTVVSCFIPVFGYFFAGTFGAIALIMIIVAMAQGDHRGLHLLLIHMIGTPLACLFASIVSCGAILGTMGTGAGAVAAISKPTQLLTSTAITEPTPLLASTPKSTIAPASNPEPTIAAASTPEPTVVDASAPALEMLLSTSVVSAVTSNQWSGDALIVLGTLKNTNAVPVRIENLSAAGFDKDQKRVTEGSDYTIVHNDLAAGETVNFQVSLTDGTKQIRFVKLTPKVAKHE